MKTHRRVIVIAFIFILVLALIISGLRVLESTVLYPEEPSSEIRTSKTITIDENDYFPRQDITVVMLLGIDGKGPMESSGYFRNETRSDMAALLILDQAEQTYSILNLNRDTMLNMPILGLGGKTAGSGYGQLALSYTYGEGLNDSCENTRKTISDFLGGIVIDHYVAIKMEAMPIINDAVGGVTVNVTDNFSAVDSSNPMGEVTLRGKQAMYYVQTRKDVGDQLNLSRMDRQKEYMQSFMEALRTKTASGDSFVLDLYEDISPYMVTDCSVNVISGLMERCSDYTLKEIVTPEGENVLGEEFYEFYVDEEQLQELVLRLFYAPKS